MRSVIFVGVYTEGLVISRMCKAVARSQVFVNVTHWLDFFNRNVPVSFSPPLVWLCGVWVDADGSVTVSDGCIGFLHLDIDTDYRGQLITLTVINNRQPV